MFLDRRGGNGRRGYDGKIGDPVPNRIDGLRRRMIADFQANAGIQAPIPFKCRQQRAMQRDLTGGNVHGTRRHITAFDDFRFSRFDVFKGDANMGVQFFALRRQLHAPVGSNEQRTSELALKRFDRARQIRLIVQQLCRAGNTAALCDVIKNPIVATFTDLVLRVLLAETLSRTALQVTGIWLSWPIGWTVAAVLSILFYATEKWGHFSLGGLAVHAHERQ